MTHKDERERLIAGEAADWFARMSEPKVSPDEREEFARWLLLSPTHVEEYLAVTRAWGDIAAAPAASIEDLVREAREAPDPAIVVPLWGSAAAKLAAPQPAMSPRRADRWLGALAASLVLALGGWLTLDEWLHPTQLETAVGEQRSITLADGSLVHLNTDSRAHVEMLEGERRVTLERGEARFTVAKDPARPFIVSTQQATVRALGTVFNVRAAATHTAVTVIEGRVAVATNDPLLHEDVELATGQKAEVTAEGAIRPDEGPSVEKVLAWTERKLVFRDESLGRAVEEFNRYHERPIRIEEPTLAGIRIGGVFSAGDPDSLIQYLERYEHVKSQTLPDGTRLLTR